MGFIAGIKEKYPEKLLQGRWQVEGNVLGCFLQDPMLMSDVVCKKDDFITEEGRLLFQILMQSYKSGHNEFTEVELRSMPKPVQDKFDEVFESYERLEHMKDIINIGNLDAYMDTFLRENILLRMHDDGFNLTEPILMDNGKKRAPLAMMRNMKAEEVVDWWESRLSSYGVGYSSKVLEEEVIDFTDDFINSCIDGEETGVPFETAGKDINGEDIGCFPFLSRQMSGLMEGTLSMIGGFSSAGKSTWLITVIMGLMHSGKKILLISNEESIKKYKIKFMVWLLYKRHHYFGLSKRKLMNGDIDDESMKHLKEVQQYWRDNYKGKIKLITINDADMMVVRKKIREGALRGGFDCFVYDTFKIQPNDMANNRTDLSLVRDSRELDKLAKKYRMIGIASIQLAESMRGTLFLSASSLSNSKQIKEILENLWLMRSCYTEELDPNSKIYCNPFKAKYVDDKYIEEPFEPDPSQVWRILFVEKGRSGENSSDNGVAYLLKYNGNYSTFSETAKCRPKHGRIE